MAQAQQLDLFANPVAELPERLEIVRDGFVWVRPVLKPILTKSDLRTHFGVPDNRALLASVITPEVLALLGLSLEDYKLRSKFSLSESHSIYKALNIAWLRTGQRAK